MVGVLGAVAGGSAGFGVFSDDHVEDGGVNTVTGDNALHGSVRTHDGYGRCRVRDARSQIQCSGLR
mgnify:FL=1